MNVPLLYSINQYLAIEALYKQKHSIQLSCSVVNDMRKLENIIQEIDSFEVPENSSTTDSSVKKHVEKAIIEIETAIDILDSSDPKVDFETENQDSICISLNFLLAQLKYLITEKHARRYNLLTQVFSLKVHGISPACYRLIHGSNCLFLPQERNLLRIKNSIGLESCYIKILKETATTFNNLERHVILQMDEIHIRSDSCYKGGRVIGSIDNPEDPPTTVFSLMISSLSAKFSTIVRLIPLGSSSAEKLFPIIKSTICDIESCNLFVEAVCTDNYPLNVSLFKLFSIDSKTLQPKVIHPCNPLRNLILLFDIVHIIKSIRNNWLNLKDYEKTFIFPKFNECLPTEEPTSNISNSKGLWGYQFL